MREWGISECLLYEFSDSNVNQGIWAVVCRSSNERHHIFAYLPKFTSRLNIRTKRCVNTMKLYKGTKGLFQSLKFQSYYISQMILQANKTIINEKRTHFCWNLTCQRTLSRESSWKCRDTSATLAKSFSVNDFVSKIFSHIESGTEDSISGWPHSIIQTTSIQIFQISSLASWRNELCSNRRNKRNHPFYRYDIVE